MDARDYQREAERCLDLAAKAPDSASTRRWRRLADKYAVLAEELSVPETGRAPMLRMPMQQQPLQTVFAKSRRNGYAASFARAARRLRTARLQ